MSFYKIEEELKKGGSDIPSLLSLCSTITPTLPITTPKEEGNGVCLFFFCNSHLSTVRETLLLSETV